MGQGPVIALLGGGQLGRMFLENALRYNVRVHVLDPDPNAPCRSLAERFVVGDLLDHDTVVRFAEHADVVGIEIEHVSTSALDALQRAGKRVIPDPSVLHTIQDKGLQKQFYLEHGIPTSPFAFVNGMSEITAASHLFPAFLKLRSGGYDGRGVMALNDQTELDATFTGPCVLEQRVDVALELAVLVVRTDSGDQITYDPVEMVFDPYLNLVDHLQAPARIDARTSHAARGLAARVAEAFGAPGLYAVELFLTRTGELLVNETAPRAHNSGHHTIEACASSQFDQLLRAYFGWPLGDPTLRSPAAMINLVGTGGTGSPAVHGMGDVLELPGTFIHLYGKSETRTGRKMGHITVTAADEEGLARALAVVKERCRIVPGPEKTTAMTGNSHA